MKWQDLAYSNQTKPSHSSSSKSCTCSGTFYLVIFSSGTPGNFDFSQFLEKQSCISSPSLCPIYLPAPWAQGLSLLLPLLTFTWAVPKRLPADISWPTAVAQPPGITTHIITVQGTNSYLKNIWSIQANAFPHADPF